jgi:hypothetical protein
MEKRKEMVQRRSLFAVSGAGCRPEAHDTGLEQHSKETDAQYPSSRFLLIQSDERLSALCPHGTFLRCNQDGQVGVVEPLRHHVSSHRKGEGDAAWHVIIQFAGNKPDNSAAHSKSSSKDSAMCCHQVRFYLAVPI